MRRYDRGIIAFWALLAPWLVFGEGGSPTLSANEMEKFLKTAKIGAMKELSEGVTNSRKASLNDGTLTHDAHVQTINEFKPVFNSASGSELNFMDSYKFNIAGYILDRMLDIGMVPMSVDRKVGGTSASVTWWVDDSMMTEKERYQKNIQPKDADAWNRQMNVVRVFDELIYNTDRNLGNLVITKDWDIWMIDHTRGFRISKALRAPKQLSKCDKHLFEKMKELNKADLSKEMKGYLNGMQIDGLLARRDIIVKFFEKEAGEKGEKEVFYTYLPRK
jgi:hypothetical protein